MWLTSTAETEAEDSVVSILDEYDAWNQTSPGTKVTSDATVFSLLVQRWHEERAATSSISEMAACDSYQRIIGMGQAALPNIFRRLRRELDDPDHWHMALKAITGENPVPNKAYGDLRAIANAWLAWALTKGYSI